MDIAKLKNLISDSIKNAIKKSYGIVTEINLISPPDIKLGDFTVEFFAIAKSLQMSPTDVSQKIAQNISCNIVDKAVAAGPYLNIKIKNDVLFPTVIGEIFSQKEAYGNTKNLLSERIMTEYLSPNTNKPLHLGHLRNGALGMAVSNILEANGAKVIKSNLVNDRGIHICKSMIAWQKWGNDSSPQSMNMKGDHFVGYYYVKFSQEVKNDPNLDKEAQDMLIKWEHNDPETLELWQKMNAWVFAGFADTYAKLGLKFDVEYHESETYKLGKKLVDTGVQKGVFVQEPTGAITATLPEAEFGVEKNGALKKATLIRNDGTSVYITQDLETAKLKFDQFDLTQSIYVVGSEQDYHFKVLFQLLKMLGFPWAPKCHHLSYGMVYLPEGKMKSREGKVVDADDLIDEMKMLAKDEIIKRHTDKKLPESEIDSRASKVAIAAINYYLLQFSPRQDIHFDPKASLAFEGNTGPYCQYTYARAISILNKNDNTAKSDLGLLGNDDELILLNKLVAFPTQIEEAARDYNPSKITTALYEIAKSFNQFYQKNQVLNLEDKPLSAARVELVNATAITIKKGLALLNIETLMEM